MMRFLPSFLLAFSCLGGGLGFAAPMITEFAANSDAAIPDEDGSLQDWIEIHNPDSTPISLKDWYLTDNVTQPTQWKFPAVTLAAGDYLLVYASGKNRKGVGQPLHTNFSLKKEGEYLALVRPDGQVEQEFAPAFLPHLDGRSYGLGFVRTTVLDGGADCDYRVPQNAGELAGDWNTSASTPTGWTTGKTGLGFRMWVPGFTNRIRALQTDGGAGVWGQADAIALLGLPAGDPAILAEETKIISTFNYLGEGADGHYGDNLALPTWALNHYVNQVTGQVMIPRTGNWTFGMNSDDGGQIRVDGTLVMDDPGPHAVQDHLGTIWLEAGMHAIEAWYYERAGGDEGELYAAEGSYTSWNSGMRLVGDTANGGLEVFTMPVGGVSGGDGLLQTDLTSAMEGKNASAFVRIVFDAPAEEMDGLYLEMRYNDGFVAWVNGVEVARSNAPSAGSWDSAATVARSADDALIPQSFNISSILPGLSPTGNVLAIQGLNVSAGDGNFLIQPRIRGSKSASSAIWGFFDHPTPGAANDMPGSLGRVATPEASPGRGLYPNAAVASVPFLVTLTHSVAGADIRYTTDGSTPSETYGALYTGPITLTGTTVLRAIAYREGWEPSAVATHTYLVLDDVLTQSPNGEVPGPGWPTPSGGRVSGQKVDYGMDPEIVYHTNPEVGGVTQVRAALAAIPSVSIVTDATNLWGAAAGIYVNPGYRGLAWERNSSIELLNDPGGGFQVNAGLRIRGGYSRSKDNPKHAFRLYFRKEYGAGRLKYPVFGDEGAADFDQIDLRTSQNYSWSFGGDARNTFLREEFSRQSFVDMGWPGSHVKYVHLYLNGHYWGLYNFDERPESDHCTTYLGGVEEDWDVVKSEQDDNYRTGATSGSIDSWNELFAKANPLVAPSNYTRRILTEAEYYDMQGLAPDGVTTNASPVLLDVDALIDYMLLTFWTGNFDGATSSFLGNNRANNWFGAHNPEIRQGFVYFPHDFEHSLLSLAEDRTGPYNRTFNSLSSYQTKRSYYNPMFLHADLLDVPAYKRRWQDRVQHHLFNGGALDLNANLLRMQKLVNIVDSAIIAESARWGDMSVHPPRTRLHWKAEKDTIVNTYLPARTSTVISQLRADGLYPGLAGVSVLPPGGYTTSTEPIHLSHPDGGTVSIYYTLNGNDPMGADGLPIASAQLFTLPVNSTNTLVTSGEAGPGATWRYLEPSSDLGSSAIVAGHPSYDANHWKHPSYNDLTPAWKSGDAELGYGDAGKGRPERTQIDIGPAGNRYPVCYFRRQFTVENPAQYGELLLHAMVDDGAIFFINGHEVGRINMPAGDIGYQYSGLLAPGVNEYTFLPILSPALQPSVLVVGTNQFAVQVHNVHGNSGDISFDLRLQAVKTTLPDPQYFPPGDVLLRARAYNGSEWSALSDVRFWVDTEPASAGNLVISQLHYHPKVTAADELAGFWEDSPFEFLELMNAGNSWVDLYGIQFTRGITWSFQPAATTSRLLAPGARAILAKNTQGYLYRYPTAPSPMGLYSGNLANSGERLTLLDASGGIIRDFTYDDQAPWPEIADGDGPSLVLIRPTSLPDHAVAANWRASMGPVRPGLSDALSYASWKLGNAPGQNDFDDADNDGVPLLFEYVHGGDPTQPGPGLLPWAEKHNVPEEILFRFDLRAGVDDIALTPEVSTDMENWDSTGLILRSRMRISSDLDRLTWVLQAPYDSLPRVYLRLRAELP